MRAVLSEQHERSTTEDTERNLSIGALANRRLYDYQLLVAAEASSFGDDHTDCAEGTGWPRAAARHAAELVADGALCAEADPRRICIAHEHHRPPRSHHRSEQRLR